ncbi:MAG: hypothetical protein ACPLTR_11640, partial [Thermacetogeniaceae bacterium]
MKGLLQISAPSTDTYQNLFDIYRETRGLMSLKDIPLHFNSPIIYDGLDSYAFAVSIAVDESVSNPRLSYRNENLGQLIIDELANRELVIETVSNAELYEDCLLQIPRNLIIRDPKWPRYKKIITEALTAALLLYLNKSLPDKLL